MATIIQSQFPKVAETRSLSQRWQWSSWDGFFLFALIFLVAAPNHFTRQTNRLFSASQGVPLAFPSRVPLSGVGWPIGWRAPSAFCWGIAQKLGAWLICAVF